MFQQVVRPVSQVTSRPSAFAWRISADGLLGGDMTHVVGASVSFTRRKSRATGPHSLSEQIPRCPWRRA